MENWGVYATGLSKFGAEDPSLRVGGLVLSPQVFAELNFTNWMKIRTGLSYNFYNFENQKAFTTSDLQGISFTVGFLFGRFN